MSIIGEVNCVNAKEGGNNEKVALLRQKIGMMWQKKSIKLFL